MASYIFAKNRNKQEKIAMTAPVSQSPIETTSSTITNNKDGFMVGFVIPDKYKSLDQLPQPIDNRVELKIIKARKVAVISYSGTWSQSNYLENESKLRKALGQLNLKPLGPSEWARYNPPFTLWFMRHNEIMIEIEGTK